MSATAIGAGRPPIEMKQTRSILISDKVFTSQDLMRIARIFNEQEPVAKQDQVSTQYEVTFDDDTRFESETPEVLQEESLTAYGRPVAIEMSYRNYTRNRYMFLSLNHGDSSRRNRAEVSASGPTWLNANFQSLHDALNRVRPQQIWFHRHPYLLLNLIAFGIGCAFFLLMDAFDWLIVKIGWHDVIFQAPASWIPVLTKLLPFLIIADLLLRWVVGLAWGAFGVQRWLLAAWPSIEFDFGLPHLQIEKIRRQRLVSVFVLIVVPILTSLLYDLIKHAFD